MKDRLKQLTLRMVVISAIAALCFGVYGLETSLFSARTSYLYLLGGASLLAMMGGRSDRRESEHSLVLPWVFILAAATCACLVLKHAAVVKNYGRADVTNEITLWMWAVGLCLAAAYYLDRRLSVPSTRRFDTSDYVLGALIFVAALGLRLVGPSTAAPDEVIHFSEMRSLKNLVSSPWTISANAYPFLFYWLIYFTTDFFSPILDAYDLDKLLSAIFASLSVSAFYFVVRLFSARHVATSAAILLTFFGWHWVNSRFIYLYPYDLALMMFGALSALLAFQGGRALPATVSGIVCALALISAHIAVFVLPFTALIFLDYLLVPGVLGRSRIVRVACVMGTSFILAYAPYIAVLLHSDAFAALFMRSISARAEKERRMAAMGISPSEDFFFVLKDAFYQFQIQAYDTFRHYFRPDKPLLDPVLSGLSTLGFVVSLKSFLRRRECRIALVGTFVFIVPMILSFPLYSTDPHGLSRRMIGTSFFIAWLGALGAEAFAKVVVREVNRPRATVMLCCCSALFNVYALFAVYFQPPPLRWLTDHGIHRSAMLRAARHGGAAGIKTIVLVNEMTRFNGGTSDLPSVSVYETVDQVRAALQSGGPGLYLVILPQIWSPTGVSSQGAEMQLVDRIPLHTWLPGELDPAGVPMFAKAYVLVK